MAKKAKKQQLSSVSPPISHFSAPAIVSAPPAALPVPVLSPPTSTVSPPVPASSPPPYKPITDEISIERLVDLAKDSLPDSALGIVWRRAFEEGKKLGYSEGAKLFEGADVNEISRVAMEKGIEIGRNREKRAWGAAGHTTTCITVARPPRGVAVQTENGPPRPVVTAAVEEARNCGYEQGYKEGSSSKVDLFQAGYDEGRRDEQGDWIIEGHGQHCGFQPTVFREDSSVQTNNPPPRSVATAAIQVDTPKPPPPLHIAVQADAPQTIPFTT